MSRRPRAQRIVPGRPGELLPPGSFRLPGSAGADGCRFPRDCAS